MNDLARRWWETLAYVRLEQNAASQGWTHKSHEAIAAHVEATRALIAEGIKSGETAQELNDGLDNWGREHIARDLLPEDDNGMAND